MLGFELGGFAITVEGMFVSPQLKHGHPPIVPSFRILGPEIGDLSVAIERFSMTFELGENVALTGPAFG